MNRDEPALGPPGDTDLRRFPSVLIGTGTRLHRGHRRTLGPWWFAADGGGRFDLSEPHGTCYLAYNRHTAVRETIGHTLAAGQVLPAVFADQRVVSALRLPHPAHLADTCHEKAAAYGLTRELSTITPYALPQRWAEAFHEAGHDGIEYQTRFTTAAAANAAAVFGPAGDAGWEADSNPEPFADAARSVGMTISAPPRRVRIAIPPGRRR